MLVMAGFGALALLQGMQVYHMQKQLQKQNQIILETTEQSEDSAEESKEAPVSSRKKRININVRTDPNPKKSSFSHLSAHS